MQCTKFKLMEQQKQPAERPPKRPLTPYFQFRQSEQGKSLGGAKAAKVWKSMREEDRRPYIDEYRKQKFAFDQYYEAYYGFPPAPSKPNAFNVMRIKAVCMSQGLLQSMDTKLFQALGKVYEAIIADLVHSIREKLRKKKKTTTTKDTITLETIQETVEAAPYFRFLESKLEIVHNEDRERILQESGGEPEGRDGWGRRAVEV